MNRIKTSLAVLLASVTSLTSCLKDNDTEVTTYADTAIMQVTLGTLNRYTHTTSSYSGNDTVVRSTIAGSAYNLTIDHLGGRIYNQDSLPTGTDISHVTITVATKNRGFVVLQSLTSDSVRYVSSTDSVDFTQPRTLIVYSSDGQHQRNYTMTLGVSTTTGVSFGWTQVATRDDLVGWADSHLVAWADSVALVPEGVVVRDGCAYRIADSATHNVQTSIDLDTWTPVATAADETPLVRLIGCSTYELYGVDADGRLYHSADDGLTWAAELLDDSETLLPVADWAVVCWPYAPADHTDYVLLVGTSADASRADALLWRKLNLRGDSGRWVYMPVDANNSQPLPARQGLSLARYGDAVLALGDDLVMRRSRDEGITWQTPSTYALPATFEGTRATMTTDRQGRLWLLTDAGQLWVGQKL